MPNLKLENFPLRGKIGELIAKSHIPYSSRVQELAPKYLFKRFSFGYIPPAQRSFLQKYWKSFDLLRILTSEDSSELKAIEIYEVKTITNQRENHKLAFTQKSATVYRRAPQFGIKPKVVKIVFYNDWNYSLKVQEFDEDQIEINDGNKKTGRYTRFLERSLHFLNKRVPEKENEKNAGEGI